MDQEILDLNEELNKLRQQCKSQESSMKIESYLSFRYCIYMHVILINFQAFFA